MPLERLGPYRILHPLGRGGMGTVYSAVDMVRNLPVAVKVLAPSVAHDAGFRERFAAEVRSLEQLRHPHIVQLYGYGEQDGYAYYAMELMSGRSLQEELAAGRRFGWREAVPIIVDLCGALKHAHDHGIIHRDIKPANLLIEMDAGPPERETVKLSDFGIAKLFGNQNLTMDGGVLGTADYMSPEQAEGEPVSPRSDLYSLGCVLYALLAGRPPFRGKSIPDVIHKVRFDPPSPISRFVEDIPAELERLLEQLLQKQPSDRVPTALALSKRLQALQHGLTLRPAKLREKPSAPTIDVGPNVAVPTEVTGEFHFRDTMAAAGPAGEPAAAAKSTSKSATPDHFVSVVRAPRRKERPSPLQEPLTLRWLQTAGLLALLGFLAWGAWFVLTPPSADELYSAIERIRASRDVRLGNAEPKVKQFLRLYNDDRRAGQVLDWQEQIEASRIEQRLERMMRNGWSAGKGAPFEELVMRGMQLELNEPDQAMQLYKNLLAMHPPSAEQGAHDRLLTRVIDQRLQKMRVGYERSIETHIALILNRVEKAESLVKEDPAAARELLTATSDTYAEFSWAQPAIDEVRQALRRLEGGTETP